MRLFSHKSVAVFLGLAIVAVFGPSLYAQTTPATNEAQVAAGALGQQSFISLLISFFVPRLIEPLKSWTTFPLVQDGAKRLNRLFAVGVSVVQGSGLTWSYHVAASAAGSGDGWQLILGSNHSSFEEWIMACITAYAAQQFFYEQMPAVQADSMARALARAIRENREL